MSGKLLIALNVVFTDPQPAAAAPGNDDHDGNAKNISKSPESFSLSIQSPPLLDLQAIGPLPKSSLSTLSTHSSYSEEPIDGPLHLSIPKPDIPQNISQESSLIAMEFSYPSPVPPSVPYVDKADDNSPTPKEQDNHNNELERIVLEQHSESKNKKSHLSKFHLSQRSKSMKFSKQKDINEMASESPVVIDVKRSASKMPPVCQQKRSKEQAQQHDLMKEMKQVIHSRTELQSRQKKRIQVPYQTKHQTKQKTREKRQLSLPSNQRLPQQNVDDSQTASKNVSTPSISLTPDRESPEVQSLLSPKPIPLNQWIPSQKSPSLASPKFVYSHPSPSPMTRPKRCPAQSPDRDDCFRARHASESSLFPPQSDLYQNKDTLSQSHDAKTSTTKDNLGGKSGPGDNSASPDVSTRCRTSSDVIGVKKTLSSGNAEVYSLSHKDIYDESRPHQKQQRLLPPLPLVKKQQQRPTQSQQKKAAKTATN